MINELRHDVLAEKKDKKAQRRRERELTDIREILMTPGGRRFYWRLMEEGGIFRDAFCVDSTNSTNYQLGRQSISREFFSDLLEARPDMYAIMQKERTAEAKADEQQDELDKKQNGGLV